MRRALVWLVSVMVVAGCSSSASTEVPVSTTMAAAALDSTPTVTQLFQGAGESDISFGSDSTSVTGILCSRNNEIFQAVGELPAGDIIGDIRVIVTDEPVVIVTDSAGDEWTAVESIVSVNGDLIEVDGPVVSGTRATDLTATIRCNLEP